MKKKFGILTFYNAENYGAVLQAYALQKTIQKYGFDADHVQYTDKLYTSNEKEISILKKIITVLKLSNYNLFKYFKTRSVAHNASYSFIKFRKDYISTSEQVYSKDDIDSSNSIYDGFVCGSDMVWTDIGQDLDVYFLTFAPYDKRIAYAPSITGTKKYSTAKNIAMKDFINGIKYLSVREKIGVEYINKITGRNAFHAVDPTLLLEKKEWKKLLNIKNNNKEKYILVYMFQGSKQINKKIKKFAKENNLKIRYIPMTVDERYTELKNGYSASYGPKEFVELFYNASFVITNSFHGLLFSLNFNIPFLLIHRGKGNKWLEHEGRMTSILNLLNLSNRFIFEDNDFTNEFLSLNYSDIDKKIKKLRNDSLDYLFSSLDDVVKNKENKKKVNINQIIKSQCTGCSACVKSCPVGAISMLEDKEGFLFPFIDTKKCIKCGKCIRVCQVENKEKFNNTLIKSYLGHSIINEKSSASGGIFVTIARKFIIEKKGYVVGASIDNEKFKVEHVIIDNIDDLEKLQNSKYVQSDMNSIYNDVKILLDNGNWVLFSGTPCQIAGLKHFLTKEYDRLYTIDIVCHGVPSPKFWKKNIDFYMKKFNFISKIQFRHKDDEERVRSTYQLKFKTRKGLKYVSNGFDPYYNSFIKGQSYRLSCYHCKYKCLNRLGDITVGDCDSWRKQGIVAKDRTHSIILINTEKGENLFEEVNSQLYYQTLDLNEEVKVNTPLSSSEKKPIERQRIYNDLDNMSWTDFLKKYTIKETLFLKIKSMIKRILLKR